MIEDGTEHEIGEMERGDDGPAELRARLPFEFRAVSLRQIRDAIAYHNKGARARKKKLRHQRSVAERIKNTAKSHFKPVEHSPELKAYYVKPSWLARARMHREDCDYRCQVCTRQHGVADTLNVHHVFYPNSLDGTERTQDLLCACKDGCHPLMDLMRRHGREVNSKIDRQMLAGVE